MKAFAVLIILTALGLLGSAFFGVYTAPGLENLPTVESLGKERMKAKKELATEDAAPKGTIIPINKNGKMTQRNNYLNQNRGKVAPGVK